MTQIKKSTVKKKKKLVSKKSTKHFQNPVLFYATLAIIVLMGLIANYIWTNNTHRVLGATTNLSPSTLLIDTNNYRVEYHESNLSINSDLMNAAQTKANDMVTRDYWSHNTPSGIPPWTFITNAGYSYQRAGENLAYGFESSQAVLSAWMHSPEHRANILDSYYQNVGFGIASSPNYQGKGPATLIVAMYGQPATAAVATATTTFKNINLGSVAPAKNTVDRIQQLLGSNNALLGISTVVISLALFSSLIIRHSIKWRRIIVNGESFIHEHPLLDLGLISVVMLGYIFSQTAGYIG